MKVDEFLPVGTIIKLKGTDKLAMIVSHCIIPTDKIYNKDGEVDANSVLYYEYGICDYPEGLKRTNFMYAINHDKIERIIYIGFQNAKYSEYKEQLKELETNLNSSKDLLIDLKSHINKKVEIPMF